MPYVPLDDSPLPRHTVICRCSACSCVYANSDALPEHYLQHYQSNSIYADAGLRQGAGLDVNDHQRLEKVGARIASRLNQNSLVIDIGAGTGGLLRHLVDRFGCRVLGMDPDPACVQSMQRQGIPSVAATLDDLPANWNGKADVVVLSHVLEHLWSAQKGLQAALRLLAPGGCIYVETPDAARYADYPNAVFYYFDPEHINHFSMEGLRNLAVYSLASCIDAGESEINLADGTQYPVCWALIVGAQSPCSIKQDRTSLDIERYVRQQEALCTQWRFALLQELKKIQGDYLIWGVGSQSQRALASSGLDHTRIRAFVDSDVAKQGRFLLGKPIYAPEQAMSRFTSLPILILAARSASKAIGRVLSNRWPERTFIDAMSLL